MKILFDDINDLNDDELRAKLKEIRLRRKTGFEYKPRKSSNPYKDLPPEVAEKLIAELKEKGLL